LRVRHDGEEVVKGRRWGARVVVHFCRGFELSSLGGASVQLRRRGKGVLK
jgi:hypothetical protein